MSAPLSLRADGWEAVLLPAVGGAVAALRHDGRDVLRPAPDGATDALATGCFPLVPFANRIADARLIVDGAEHRLPRPFAGHPHALHGFGWTARWTAAERFADRVELIHRHDAGQGWPWCYEARQHVMLAGQVATIALSVTNRDPRPMPAGLGLHPYFPRDGATRLRFGAARMWHVDATLLPTVPAPADTLGDWRAGASVEGEVLVDNAYGGWDGSAEIVQRDHRLLLSADGADVLHVYRPPDADFFCVEPVTHLPDAINRAGTMPSMALLAPGATMAMTMRLSIG